MLLELTQTQTHQRGRIFFSFLSNGMFLCIVQGIALRIILILNYTTIQCCANSSIIIYAPYGICYLQRTYPCYLCSKHKTIITVFLSCEACPNYLVWPKLSSTPLIPVAGSLGFKAAWQHCTMSSTVNTGRRTNTWTCRCKCNNSSEVRTQRALPCLCKRKK